MPKRFKCSFCEEYFSSNHLKIHLNIKHKIQREGSSFSCNIDKCNRSFASSKTLNVHVKSKHLNKSNFLPINEQASTNTITPKSQHKDDFSSWNNEMMEIENDTINTVQSNFERENKSLECNTNQRTNETLIEDPANISDQLLSSLSTTELFESALSLISRFNFNFSLTRSQIQDVVSSFDKFLNSGFMNNLKLLILLNTKNNMADAIGHKFNSLQKVFSELNTEHKRFSFLEEQKLLIEPVPVQFGSITREKNGTEVPTIVTGQMIPLDKVLKTFFEMPEVFDKTFAYYAELRENKTKISNVVQTEFWQNIIDKSPDKVIFPLSLYEDGFETGNPLGPNAGKHKLNGVYASVACLPPEYISQLNNIFLLQLYHSADLYDFSRKVIFNDIIILLKKLESEGIVLSLPGSQFIKLHFQVVYIRGDNLGLNGILGFVESFTANFFCRICKVRKSEAKRLCVPKNNKLRDKKNYEKDVNKMNPKETGIKEPCVFNSLNNFHVTRNKSVDPMHDIPEGMCRDEMVPIINHCIKKKYFTLKTLNHRLIYISFHDFENRPPVISKND